jgi:hypothetical protein
MLLSVETAVSTIGRKSVWLLGIAESHTRKHWCGGLIIQSKAPETGIQQMRATTHHISRLETKRLLGKEIKSKTRAKHKKEEEKTRGIAMIIVI